MEADEHVYDIFWHHEARGNQAEVRQNKQNLSNRREDEFLRVKTDGVG